MPVEPTQDPVPSVPVADPATGTAGAAPASDPTPGTAPADPTAVAAAGPVSMIGVIALNRTATLAGGTTTLAASFAALPTPREVDEALADVLPAPDTCTAERGRIGGLGDEGGVEIGIAPLAPTDEASAARSVGAGDALVFTSPAGTWATLPRRERGELVGYASEGIGLSLPVPDGLVVDVPGEAFPAFAAVPVPVVPPLTGLSPGPLEAVTDATVFRWDTIAEPREVSIDVLGIDPETLETVSIGCRAIDDGEFALADAVDIAFGGGTRGVAVAIRRGTELVRTGDALLVVTGATAEAGVR